MNKINEDNEMRSEYDFSDGVRGKHYRAYQQGINAAIPVRPKKKEQ